MPRKPNTSLSMAKQSTVDNTPCSEEQNERGPKRSASLLLALFVLLLNGSWAVHYFQFESLPMPLNAEQAGKRGFSEVSAMEHVKYLTSLGPHPIGSDALDHAVQYVLAASEKIKKTSHWEVDVQVDLYHVKMGANRLVSGLFKGKTLIYSDMKHVVLRIVPKYLPEAEENVILVSSHIDTVFSTEGAGDCSSCVGVMLELARGISQWAHGFKHGVIFLFNTGEEEGLNGAHSFITQHPWRSTIRFVVDLEAMGIGGKSSIFQSGSMPWAVEAFARVAKYPSGQIIAQDLFLSGAIKSATDFQVYKEVAGLSGLDFAYSDASAVYHTKNDKMKLLKPGSLQHLGENMLSFLLQTTTSSYLQKEITADTEESSSQSQAIFFDVLGMYMVVYPQRLANMLHNSVIFQALLLWTTSLLMGGYPGAISFGLSFLSIILMWIFSLSLSILVAFILPLICSSPVPYIANPWLVAGLFGAPAVLGALAGQHIGFLLLQKHLEHIFSKRDSRLSSSVQENLVKCEAERWLFKAGSVQWLILLILGNFYKAGSSYLALVWLVSPAFAYGFMEATLTPVRLPKPLKVVTLILGLALPVLLSAGMVIRLVGTVIGIMVRFDRSPGSTPEWLGSLILAVFVAAIVCLTLVYLLSYVHFSGANGSVIFSLCALFALTLVVVSTNILPTFTEDFARAVNGLSGHSLLSDRLGEGRGSNQTKVRFGPLLSWLAGASGKRNNRTFQQRLRMHVEIIKRAVDLIKSGLQRHLGCVVHVVETTGKYDENQDPSSYISLFSSTPGKLTEEVENLKDEEIACGRNKPLDFVTFNVKYGCSTSKDSGQGWTKSDIPTLHVESDSISDIRKTRIHIDTKHSSRWVLAINTEEIRDFTFEANSEVLVPEDEKSNVDGWHIVQFSGGKDSPTKFDLNLFWFSNATHPPQKTHKQAEGSPLLKLRTDVNKITPETARILEKLPPWCSLFGKSTTPYTLAFLASLPVNF